MFAPYPHWKTLRSFSIKALQEEGMGKASLEPKILDEVEHFINWFIKPNLGKAISLKNNINQATANIISQLLYSRRFEYNDELFNGLISAICESMSLTVKNAATRQLPFSRYLFKPDLKREDYLCHEIITPTIASHVAENKMTVDRENPRNVMDRYLVHSENSKGKQSAFSGE